MDILNKINAIETKIESNDTKTLDEIIKGSYNKDERNKGS